MNGTAPNRRLIVNADDFGLSPGVNRGIVEAHEHGIVTSASLMVRWPTASEAAAYAREHPRLSVGLHFDLGEWTYADEAWRLAYEVAPADKADAVEAELARQLESFRRLMRRDPTHLDSHQHVHRSEPVGSIVLDAARKMGIVVRSFNPTVRYCGQFYGQSDKGYPYPEGISVEALLRILHELPIGFTEMACHPGESDDVRSVYRHERAVECQTLCDPRVRAAIAAEGILLSSFADAAVNLTLSPDRTA
jgi:chitin disaccharide deacetylase